MTPEIKSLNQSHNSVVTEASQAPPCKTYPPLAIPAAYLPAVVNKKLTRNEIDE